MNIAWWHRFSAPTAPKTGHLNARRPTAIRPGLLTCYFSGVGEGTRTPDPQDHNLVL
jgi:hypothetical protein